MMKKKNEKKGFIWYSLKISFWALIISLGMIFVLSFFMQILNLRLLIPVFYFIFGIFLLSIPLTFIISIIHLIRYKDKTFAIISLVISILFLIFFILGILLIKNINFS
ncbi:hypothetical protein A3K82_02450 [Candidatus Pacearchaeota archaeon RBG_19FT_COMBO_34_9]|nr:MAG: hypothetical protein A3K82_02450 [Candidatus Pacearchaeota archaeon RBG_19FT_COMBO_34_9]